MIQDEMSAAFAVYASMQANLLQTLVHRGALDPIDGLAIVRQARELLSKAPTQGALTDLAQQGLKQLEESIDPRPRNPAQR